MHSIANSQSTESINQGNLKTNHDALKGKLIPKFCMLQNNFTVKTPVLSKIIIQCLIKYNP